MGMYTQVRGWLNVDSMGFNNEPLLRKRLSDAINSFQDKHVGRAWVCNDTVLHIGANGSAFIFFGTELKNYNSDAEAWIEHLITFFPNAEGRVDFQYEEDESVCKCWLIAKGSIENSYLNDVWCVGYGNKFKG